MKVELQISETYEEEKLIDPNSSAEPKKSRKSSSSQKILTKKKQSKERLMIKSISLRLVRYNASISRIGKF